MILKGVLPRNKYLLAPIINSNPSPDTMATIPRPGFTVLMPFNFAEIPYSYTDLTKHGRSAVQWQNADKMFVHGAL